MINDHLLGLNACGPNTFNQFRHASQSTHINIASHTHTERGR